jgi:hypothetical protein
MKRFIWILLSIILVLPLGCTSGPPIAFIEWVDFIKLNNITYIRVHQDVPVNKDDVSPYSEVNFRVAGNIENPNYKTKNGDAAFLEAGTPVYSLRGYAPTFRLVAEKSQGLYVYEADTNPQARKGSDLNDIGGKVEYIGINSRTDAKTELASIKDQAQVTELVDMVLEAPVNQNFSKTGSEQYFLEFHLKDGTSTTRSYWLDTGVLSRGIQLPEEFGIAIQSASNEQQK